MIQSDMIQWYERTRTQKLDSSQSRWSSHFFRSIRTLCRTLFRFFVAAEPKITNRPNISMHEISGNRVIWNVSVRNTPALNRKIVNISTCKLHYSRKPRDPILLNQFPNSRVTKFTIAGALQRNAISPSLFSSSSFKLAFQVLVMSWMSLFHSFLLLTI